MNLPESFTDGTKPPEYVETIEALFQMPFFTDEERSEQLYTAAHELDPDDVLNRTAAYIQGLRILAVARWQDRQVAESTQPGAVTGDWNRRWDLSLTMRRVGALAGRHQEAIDAACCDLERTQAAELPDSQAGTDELFPLQHLYAEDMIAKLALPATPVFRNRGMRREAYWVKGVNGVGPTGFGKTAILGEISHRLGIGKRDENTGRRKRELIVAPTIQNANQLAGITGDNTFSRFAKGVSISVFHSALQNFKGDAIATTTEQFVKGFRKGRFFGIPIGLLAFDEVHHLTEPLVEETFFREWNGDTIGFSATPDYDNPDKDARAILPHTVSHLDILDGIDDGILNGAQIFTVVVDCSSIDVSDMTPKQKNAAFKNHRDEIIADFLTPLLQQGRRVMAFCDAGSRAEGAIQMAARLSEVALPNGKNVVAEPIHCFNPVWHSSNTEKVIRKFDARETDVLTSVRTGIESLNIDVDVITVNGVFSSLKMRQQIGRGTRKSDRFPITIYAQFLIVDKDVAYGRLPYTIYQGFGLETIEQGVTLGSSHRRHSVDTDIFPPNIQEQLAAVNHKTIGEVMLRAEHNVEIPPHYIAYDTIPKPGHISDNRAKYTLDSAGYHWAGTYDEETHTMIRFYEPEAYDHFTRHPIYKRPHKNGRLSIHEVAAYYGITYPTMRDILNDSGFPTDKEKEGAREFTYVKEAFLSSLDQFVEAALPTAQPEDISIADLAAELGVPPDGLRHLAKINDYQTRFCRQAPISTNLPPESRQQPEFTTTRQLLPAKDATALRALVKSHPRAVAEDRDKADVAAALGLTRLDRLVNFLTEEEKVQRIPRWVKDANGTLTLRRSWSKEHGDAIEARLRKELTRQLPAHLVPLLSVASNINTRLKNIRNQIRKRILPDIEKVKLGYDDERLHTCLSWEQLRRLAQTYGWLNDLAIDYDRLPTGPEDNTPDRVAYARFVQATLVERQKLGFDPEPHLLKRDADKRRNG